MTRNRWHSRAEPGRYTLARHWPPRFDVAGQARFPALRLERLALQVRQDLWRQLKGLRGFSPVIIIDVLEEGVLLTAGGRVMRPVPDCVSEQIDTLLHDPAKRARWCTWAGGARS